MAEGLFDPGAIDEAVEGFQEFSDRFATIAEFEEGLLDSLIRALRSVPAEDLRKKQELARFFQSEAGGKYSTEERKAAYDELLGTQRNRETIG